MSKTGISIVINTYNEEKNISRVLKSVQWADEIIVCDMYSQDKTVELSRKCGAEIVYHKKIDYVEPARNFAISKAKENWILLLDADEEVPVSLVGKIQSIVDSDLVDYVKIPRKNIIFNKWVQASMWWPDYNIRLFRKGKVKWENGIHQQPKTQGKEMQLPAEEDNALIHYHYNSITQYLERMNRYSNIQAEELMQNGYHFAWVDLFRKPVNEFLSRFFALRGFEDGLHGLSLSLLQSFSFLIVYLKVWEKEGFNKQEISIKQLEHQTNLISQDINYWFWINSLSKDPVKRLLQRFAKKLQ